MKPYGIIIPALCCLLIAGRGLMAQENTAPPPPPQEGTATPPPGGTAPPPPPGVQRPSGNDVNVPRARPDSRRETPAASRTAPVRESPSRDTAAQGAGGQQASGQNQGTRSRTAAAAEPGASRKRGLYGGLTAGISAPMYNSAESDGVKPEFGAFLGWHLAKLGIQIEALIAFDSGIKDQIRFEGSSLLLPIIGKYDINIKSFVIQPLIGPYFNIALGDMHGTYQGWGSYGGSYKGDTPYANPPLGLMVGSDFGWVFKRGMLFLDARFAFDLGKTVYAVNGSEVELWRKTAFTLSLGYQFN